MRILNSVSKGAAISCLAVLLAACQPGSLEFPSVSQNGTGQQPSATQQQTPALSANVSGERVGKGTVRVALLVPKSAAGGGGIAGAQIANAAKLAMRDFGNSGVELVIKDTQGQAASAQALASEALREGASLVLGPLFSANVSSASAITLPAGKSMIAFSSDINRARAGVYLLSFAPQDDIQRTLVYGYSAGATNIIAFLPETKYGSLVEQEMRSVAAQTGLNISAVARYKPDANSIVSAAQDVALAVNSATGIYIPEGGQIPSLVLKALKRSGVSIEGKQILGSGQWESVKKSDPVLEGAIFAGAEKSNFQSFAARYRQSYGNEPTVTAALGYDAVSLCAELMRRSRTQPFSRQAIESASGFNGASGLFRFRSNGRLQRGLVVNQIRSGQITVVSPAPRSFGPSG